MSKYTEQNLELDGFDPLDVGKTDSDEIRAFFENAKKRDILNILRCYTGFLDCFSELIQNSLDAVEKRKSEEGTKYLPKIFIDIDIHASTVRVIDNGIGMPISEFRYCVSPGISFKNRGDTRGHKGVGATFLAYGFTQFKIRSKWQNQDYAVSLENGRRWAEDRLDNVPKPKFQSVSFPVSQLADENSGTAVEIHIGDAKDERPNFGWLNVTSACAWMTMLRLKTPLGGVYLDSPPFTPEYTLRIYKNGQMVDEICSSNVSYLFPHELPVLSKVCDLEEITKKWSELKGDRRERFKKMPVHYKKLDCIWQLWDSERVLSSLFRSGELSDEEEQNVRRHHVCVYGAFVRSKTVWDNFQKRIGVRPQFKLIEGGLQLASDYMVQGDLMRIPLTTAAGYGANAHIVVHFKDGNPDMGRKVFQPELKQLAEKLAVNAVAEFRKFLPLLKPDTGAKNVNPGRELHDWIKAQEAHHSANPLQFFWKEQQLKLSSKPQEEQDVVALYHELIGMGVIDGLYFYASTSNEKYDGVYIYQYKDTVLYYEKGSNPLGIAPSMELPQVSAPLIIEYKYDFDALVRDIEGDIKSTKDIALVVCWQASGEYMRRFTLHSLLIDEEGSTRENFGATHTAHVEGYHEPQFEVVIIEDLLNYLRDPEEEEARQKRIYV